MTDKKTKFSAPTHLELSQGESFSSDKTNLLENIQNQLMTDEQRKAYYAQIKAESYMRWLAFYYLGRREHSQKELREKLLAKQCSIEAVEKLLEEFAQEGYQSDERMTSAVIKEGIRKGHGHQRILQTLKQHKLNTIQRLSDIDNWINNHTEFFTDSQTIENQDNTEIDWLLLAVEARVKKYGSALPTTAKDKAKQFRFLQYRGFTADICFEALKYNLDNLVVP